MPPLDATVAHVLDNRSRPTDPDSDDEDALIAALEDDSSADFSSLREKRIEQLHAEMTRAKAMRSTSHGIYTEIKDEKELMDIVKDEALCVVHFLKSDFGRCRYMEEKLRGLAEKHFDTRFVGISVDNAPFLVVKLGIQVLPCVIGFRKGVSVDRIVGFEGIGYKADSFTLTELEERLLGSGLVVRSKMTKEDDRRRAQREREVVEDDGDDWD